MTQFDIGFELGTVQAILSIHRNATGVNVKDLIMNIVGGSGIDLRAINKLNDWLDEEDKEILENYLT